MPIPFRHLRALGLPLLLALALVAGACGGGEADEGTTAVETADGGTGTDVPANEEAPTDGAASSGTEATQASGESCYEGETATFVVSTPVGGGFDTIARAIAPYLEEELGGTVVVENQVGAGGLLALNSLATAEPDGLRFDIHTGTGTLGSVLGEAEGINFDVMDLSFVGRVAADERVLVTSAGGDLETIEDVLAAGQPLRYGATGPGGNDYIDAAVLLPTLGIDGEIVTGFTSGSETGLALTAGDIDLVSGSLGSRLGPIEAGDHIPLLAIGSERLEQFPDVPALTELDLDEESQAVAQAHSDLQAMGRMVWAPPGVPQDCLAELTTAFANVLQNPDLVAQLATQDQEVGWVPGEEMRETAESLLNAPPRYVELLQGASGG